MKTDVADVGEKLEKAIKSAVEALGRIDKKLETLSALASATGLDLSVTSMRNIRRLFEGERGIEKIDPTGCDAAIFKEILGVDWSTAHTLSHHFWNSNNLRALREVKGIRQELIERVGEDFLVVDEPGNDGESG